MNIIFVGGYFPEKKIDEFLNKSKLQFQYAANTFQWGLIHGIQQISDKQIKLISSPFLGWFPKYYKDINIKSCDIINENGEKEGRLVGFTNLPIIKNFIKSYNLFKEIKLNISKSENDHVILSTINPYYLKAAIRIKKIFPKIKLCVVVSDLPELKHDPESRRDINIITWVYKEYIEKPATYKLLNKFDSYVVLTNQMANFLNICDRPWVRIEGIFDNISEVKYVDILLTKEEKTILYTGSLNYSYGIRNLLDAFKLIKDDSYKLWICGGGPGENLIKERILEDKRIQFWGMVSKKTIRDLQKKATLLVNPRNSIGEYNKYSFPSKTMEYLASGTPTLIYKLEGIPEEYYNYCFTLEDSNTELLAKTITEICMMDTQKLNELGVAARKFIYENKNSKVQCGKILKMLESIETK